MTQDSEQSPAAQARAIAESLMSMERRGAEWADRWDKLEQLLERPINDADLRRSYLAASGEAGDVDQDVLATACLIAGLDI